MAISFLNKEMQNEFCEKYDFSPKFVDNNQLCLVIPNMGKLLKEHGFIDKSSVADTGWGKSRTKSSAKLDSTTGYTIAARLEQEVMNNYFILGYMDGRIVINVNDKKLSFRLRELTEEYEGKFVAYYEYVVTEQDSEKGAEV